MMTRRNLGVARTLHQAVMVHLMVGHLTQSCTAFGVDKRPTPPTVKPWSAPMQGESAWAPSRNRSPRPRTRTPKTSCSPSPKSPTSSASPSPPCATGATSAPVPAASASAAASATGTTKSPPGCKAKATAPPPHESWSSQRLGRTRHVATSAPGRSLPWKHKDKARDDVMKLRAIHKTSKALLETMEHRRTDTREALEGQGHG